MVDHGEGLEKNGAWRNIGEMEQAQNIRQRKTNNPKEEAKNIRENLKYFFCNNGRVSWQEKMIAV